MKLKLKFFLLQSTKTMRLSNPRNRSQWNIVKFNKEGSVFFFLLDSITYDAIWGITETTAGIYLYFFDPNNDRMDPSIQSLELFPMSRSYQCDVYIKETDRLWTRGQYPGTWTTLQNKWKKGFAKIPGASSIVQCSEWHREGCTIITFFFEILWP